ncbi:MAG: hypothetical protein KAG37_07890 [Flavobacteriales bacterium]|nr:hypothetical protein [Flavobacteriales bacterium]
MSEVQGDEISINTGVSVSKIGMIKTFKGSTPPDLKRGELATDGASIFLRLSNGNIAKFLSANSIIEMVGVTLSEHIQQYH